jgi:hypothetical protein
MMQLPLQPGVNAILFDGEIQQIRAYPFYPVRASERHRTSAKSHIRSNESGLLPPATDRWRSFPT